MRSGRLRVERRRLVACGPGTLHVPVGRWRSIQTCALADGAVPANRGIGDVWDSGGDAGRFTPRFLLQPGRASRLIPEAARASGCWSRVARPAALIAGMLSDLGIV